MRKCNWLMIVFLALAAHVFAQSDSTELEESKRTTLTPRFDIHLGVGWHKGFRVGGRMLFHERWSLEASVGDNPRSALFFLAVSDPERRYGIGLNWHPKRFYVSVISFSITGVTSPLTVVPNKNPLNYMMIALDVGYLSLASSGLGMFVRGGIGHAFYRCESKYNCTTRNKYQSDGWVYDIDIGVNFSIP